MTQVAISPEVFSDAAVRGFAEDFLVRMIVDQRVSTATEK
jgi:hypothetical protein